MPKYKLLAGAHREEVDVKGEVKVMKFDSKVHNIVESDKPLDKMFVGKFVKTSDRKKASVGVDTAAQQPWLTNDGVNNHRNLVSPEEAAALEEEDDVDEEEEASPKLKKAMAKAAKQRKEVAKLDAPTDVDEDEEEEEDDSEDEDEEEDEEEDDEEEEPEEKPVKKTVVKPAKEKPKKGASKDDDVDVTKDFKVAKDNDLTVFKTKEGGFVVKDGNKVLNEEGVPFKRSNQVREFLKAHVTD